MSYTFGGATADDITGTTVFVSGADNGSCLVCGWWYPTTLTATRGYWSCGNTFGAEVDATTSEIRMRTDNTTDGQWLTSGAGITTNKWWFLAFLSATENTTVAGAWRVWVGDADNPPAEKTVTNPTARSGNYTGNSNFYLGNKGTGTLAFQGQIGWACIIGSPAVGHSNPFSLGTSGVINDWEAQNTKIRWVDPIYRGSQSIGNYPTALLPATYCITHFDLTAPLGTKSNRSHTNAPANTPPTINGATFSHNQPPRRLAHDWTNQLSLIRR